MSNVKLAVIGLCCISLMPRMVLAEKSSFYSIIGPDGHVMIIDRNAAVTPAGQPGAQGAASPASPGKWNVFKRLTSAKKTPPPGQGSQSAAPARPLPSIPANQSANQPANQSANQPANQPATSAAMPPQAPVQSTVMPAAHSSLSAGAVPPVSAPAATVAPAAGEHNRQAGAGTAELAPPAASPVQVIDGQAYIDSEYLEQREFNLDGKKRFYHVPDGLGGTQVIEREKGVDMSVFRPFKTRAAPPAVVTLSKNYQRLPREQVVALTGVQCFSAKQLKQAKTLQPQEGLNFWPRPGFAAKFDFVVAKLAAPVSDVELTSYASSMQNPQFYWPLPIFLDAEGCVLEGVNAFYQHSVPASFSAHQGLQGHLHLPDQTRYILLTPLESAAEVGEHKLTNHGQIRLVAVR